MKDFRQDVVRAEVSIVGRGVAKVQPSKDLPPGQYAIVLRPADRRKKFAGSTVLRGEGEGRALAAVWDFVIR